MENQPVLPSYIVTFHTFALLHGQHANPYYTKVIESDRTLIIEKTPLEIMRDSCKHYRTNFETIMESSKNDLENRSKPPIMLTHSNNRPLLFFPLLSPVIHKNSWVAYHAVKDAKPLKQGVAVLLKNDHRMHLDTSIATIYRQMALSHILAQRFEHAQEDLKSSYYLIMESKSKNSPIIR